MHPRVEPEVAFLLKYAPRRQRDADAGARRGGGDRARARADRLALREFKFTLEDVVADNSSSSGFATGGWHKPDLDLANLGIVMTRSTAGRSQISSTARRYSAIRCARSSPPRGSPPRPTSRSQPGWIVMAGGATAAEALAPGTWVECEIQHLGRVGFTVSG